MRFANPRGHGLKVLVCGSRNWLDREAINARVAALPPGSIVIQGGARGADLMARHAAALANLHCAEVPAMWRNGKGAGHARNRAMLDLGPDIVIAFQLGGSTGTQGTIDEARRRGIPVEVHEKIVCPHGVRGVGTCADCYLPDPSGPE